VIHFNGGGGKYVILVSTDTASAGENLRHADGQGREEMSMIKILVID